MMIVMQETATEEEVEAVVAKIERAGARAHRSSGARVTVIGAIGDVEQNTIAVDPWTEGLYQTYDVTSIVQLNQKNVIGISLGANPTDVRAEMVADYADGSSLILDPTSGSTWRTTPGPVTFSNP